MPDAERDLEVYRAKRDFMRTKEPAGRERPNLEGPTFVVQKHDARRLHYDVRLEVDGVLKSWAVPKGPSYDPSARRLAVMTEDHPMDYADFEGIIPQGEYGGGSVIVWDRGRYVPIDKDGRDITDPEQIHAHMRRAIDQGRLRFRLDGEKLHGGWTLVRTARDDTDKDASWLLIKRRDRAADPTRDVMKEDASVLSARTLADVILEEGTPAEAARRLGRTRRARRTVEGRH